LLAQNIWQRTNLMANVQGNYALFSGKIKEDGLDSEDRLSLAGHFSPILNTFTPI